MITVGGEAVNPGGDAVNAVNEARLELKLCRALAALSPPRDLSLMVHARAAELLRVLRNHDVPDPGAIGVADLGDGELKEATGVVLAFRALPSCGVKGFHGGVSFRAVLGEYALDLAAELDARAARPGPSRPVPHPHGTGSTCAGRSSSLMSDSDREGSSPDGL